MDLRTTRTIRSAIEIRAPLEIVWRVLTDFESYPDWNPQIRKLRGTPRVGARISVHSRPPGGREVVMRPRVVTWSPPRELRWRATFIAARLFTGEHGFRLDPIGDERVRFTHEETFKGLLVPLYGRLRLERTRAGFARMNEALRARAEAPVAMESG